MVAAGEVGGILDNIMNRLAVYMEKAARLKAKIKGAMIYPASIVTVAIAVTGIRARIAARASSKAGRSESSSASKPKRRAASYFSERVAPGTSRS